jgi:uncharacterized membrane protein YozB (DUF420 family)
MKVSTCIVILCLLIAVSILILPTSAIVEPSVGVKVGDWIEYNINVTGSGSPSPTHDVRWMRLQVMQVQNAAFLVNVTAIYTNGTIGSAVWKFNFTEGNLGGWIIIPANLGVGDLFFDSSIHNHKPVNVTIQGEEQKTVLGEVRTITYGNDTFRHKQWDKSSGVFVGSSETYRNCTTKDGWYIENLTVTIDASATNIWNPENPTSTNSIFYPLIIAMVIAAAVASLLIIIARRKHVTLTSIQRNLVGVVLVLGLVFAIGVIASTPISESQVPLSFREINIIMQSLWMTLLLIGMWLRRKGNYFIHGILTIAVVSITIVSFLGVLVMSPMGSGSMNEYFGSLVDVVVFLAHSVFSFPALMFGVWLVLLWRPSSASFPAKTRRLAQLTTVFWVLSYIVGILDFLIIRNHIF